MNSTQFTAALIHQFGDWTGDGMKSTVAERLKDFSDSELRRLYRWILEYYQPKRPGPPVLAEILAMHAEIPPNSMLALPDIPEPDDGGRAAGALSLLMDKLTGTTLAWRKQQWASRKSRQR